MQAAKTDNPTTAFIGPSALEENKEKNGEQTQEQVEMSLFKKLASLRQISCLSLANISVMCLILLGYGMCFSLFAPFFPNEALHKGMSSTVVGILFGSYELIIFVGSPLCSQAVNHLGLRFMIWSGMLLAGGTTVLFGAVKWCPNGMLFTTLCFALRIVEAIGSVIYLTAAYCAAGKMFPTSISFVYSLMETANGFGGMIGPSAGGLLYEAVGFYMPFVTIGGILLVFGIFSAVFLPSEAVAGEKVEVVVDADGNRRTIKVKEKEASISWWKLFRGSRKAWIVILSEAAAAIFCQFPEPTFAIYLEESLGLHNKAAIGGIFFAASIAYGVVSIIIGHLADKFSKQIFWMMASGALTAAVSFLIMGPSPFLEDIISPSVALTSTSLVLLYSAVALMLIPVPRALLDIAKEKGHSEGLVTNAMIAGLFNCLWSLGAFLGPIIAGSLLEAIGFKWSAAFMSGASLVIVIILVVGAIILRNDAPRLSK